jgi:hypothetical protein
MPRCPFCDRPMQPGSASIARSTEGEVSAALTALAGSGSSGIWPDHLYFTAPNGESTCVEHGRGAFRCSHCEAVLITGTKETPACLTQREELFERGGPWRCKACGATVASGDDHCP